MKLKQFDCPIYDKYISFCIVEKGDAEYMLEGTSLKEFRRIEYVKNVFESGKGCTLLDGAYITCFIKKEKKWEYRNTIAHELSHACINILISCGIEQPYDDEILAYLNGYLHQKFAQRKGWKTIKPTDAVVRGRG